VAQLNTDFKGAGKDFEVQYVERPEGVIFQKNTSLYMIVSMVKITWEISKKDVILSSGWHCIFLDVAAVGRGEGAGLDKKKPTPKK